jgi:hypothetical protein
MLPSSSPKHWLQWGQPGGVWCFKERVSTHQHTEQMSRLAKVE